MIVPIAVWLFAVFLRYPNPSSQKPYFVLQNPRILLHGRYILRLTLGLFINDIGPVTTALAAVGVWSAVVGRECARALWGWTLMGLVFVVLLAPKFLDHDYYGLVCVPAAAGWGAVGARWIFGAIRRRRPVRVWRAAAVIGLVALVQSPWVMGIKYEIESQHAIVAGRLDQLCTPSGRVVVVGQVLGWGVVHYSRRLGWVEGWRELPRDWRDTFRKHRAQGAELVAVTFDPTVPPRVRETYRPLLEALSILEHKSGPWFRRNQQCEYYILGLGNIDRVAGTQRPGQPERVTASTREASIRQ
jgi:hypothetical protein